MSPAKHKSSALTNKKQSRKNRENSGPQLTQEQRYNMIQETAYYIAEKSGFNDDDVKCWLAAERQINEKFS
jgi:hypothetical protein